VYNRYGSREVGNIGITTPNYNGMTLSKGVWIEIVDCEGRPVPNGVEGDIVVTSLINYAMPLIRYRIGDRGILDNEFGNDGTSNLVLKNVTGRTVDLFKNKEGAYIDGEYFTHLIYFKNWVKRFQVQQKNFTHIIIRFQLIDPSYAVPASEISEIESKIKLVMGQECIVEFKFEEIVDPPSGKFRFTISDVK
jgi:phenylacetate-CoA ligase